jgi:hypothetical protein
MRIKKLFVNLSLILVSIVITILFAEVFLRTMGLNLINDLSRRPDAKFGWVYLPNQEIYSCDQAIRPDCVRVKTNNQSLREDTDTSFDIRPGVRRVLILGDSQTAGVMVENGETYANILEELYKGRNKNPSYEVLNLGVDAYSPVQEWLLFREFGVHYHPDVIIVGFYTGNDLLDMLEIAPALRPHFEQTAQGDLVLTDYPVKLAAPDKAGSISETVKKVLRPFFVYRLSRYVVNNSILTEPLRKIGLVRPVLGHHSSRQIPNDKRPQAASICRGCILQSWSQFYYFKSLPGQEEIAFTMLNETLTRLKTEADSVNTRLIVMLIPTKLQIEPEMDKQIYFRVANTLGLGVDDAITFDHQMYDKVLALLRQLDIEVLDTLPELIAFHQQQPVKESLYFSKDWHLSPLGHRVIAEQVFQFLNQD